MIFILFIVIEVVISYKCLTVKNYNIECGDSINYILIFIFYKNSMEKKTDYMILQELTKNEKYKFWYFKIKECKESGLFDAYK